MPPMETVNLYELAVLWEPTGLDQFGQPTVAVAASGVEICVRWEEKLNEEVGPESTPVSTPDVVFVDRVIAIGSQIRRGAKADLPSTLDELREVIDYSEIPDVKGRNRQRTITLRNK